MSDDSRRRKRFVREHRRRSTVGSGSSEREVFRFADRFMFKGKKPVAVLRPRDPERVLREIEAAIALADPAARAAAVNATLDQDHQFIGYGSTASTGEVIDGWGQPVDRLQPGDAFVSCSGPLAPPAFMVTGRFHYELWNGSKVMVLPKPGRSMDSNTGVIVDSPDPSLKGAVVTRAGSGVDCDREALVDIIGAAAMAKIISEGRLDSGDDDPAPEWVGVKIIPKEE
jgi:hypothetical protein